VSINVGPAYVWAQTVGLEGATASVSAPYRPEIDGLRAIAVLAVLVFHLNPKWLSGGFVGVDVSFSVPGRWWLSVGPAFIGPPLSSTSSGSNARLNRWTYWG
jgi:hypothetical protein